MGHDAANGRYIFTKMDRHTRLLFREEDESYLPDRLDDGDIVEKEYYIPILPMVLVNPTLAGIGTGWSCNIPGFNPTDLINWIRSWFSETEKPHLQPWYRGFTGSTEVNGSRVTTQGVFEQIKSNTYRITEIPIGKRMLSISKYKEFLEDLREKGTIKTIVDHSTEEKVDFTITSTNELNHTTLGLIDTISMSNMVLFDSNNKIKKYANVEEILEEYCTKRLGLYATRKEGELRKMKHEECVNDNKIRFIQAILNETIVLKGKDEDTLVSELEKMKFMKVDDRYDYLLSIQVRSMTAKRIEQLEKETQQLRKTIKALEKTSPSELWLQELQLLEKELRI
jgi:DNA topoisomerase-2